MLKAFEKLRQAQRGASVVGFVSEPAPALLFALELSDPEAYPSAVSDILALLQLPPVVTWLAGVWGQPKLELSPKAAPGTRRARLRFRRGAGAVIASPLPLPNDLTLAWEARALVGYGAVSAQADAGLSAFWDTERLERSDWLRQSQKRHGDRTALALFVDARLFGAPAPEMAPALLTFGKDGEGILISLEAAPAALSSLSKLFALDRSP